MRIAQSAERAYRSALAALRKAKLFYGHGTHDAAEEAAYMVSHVLGVAPGTLHQHRDRPLSKLQQRRLERLVERRIAERIPVSYLTHEAWLGEFSFYVDRRVIIPRSHIADLLHEPDLLQARAAPRRVLDLCAGSGCLAVLAAHAFPGSMVDASDLSARALSVAGRNVARYGLGKRIRLIRSDLFSRLKGRRYDLIVTNPPYVTGRSMRTLPEEYRHEPEMALSGGSDGLDIVRRILHDARAHLTRNGILVCEIGGNRRVVEKAFPRLPFVWVETSAGSDAVFLLGCGELPG